MDNTSEDISKKLNDVSSEEALNPEEEENRDNAFEDRATAQDEYSEAKVLNKSLQEHLDFKNKWGGWAVIITFIFVLIVLTLLYIIIFTLHDELDVMVLLLLTTVTFANVFTAILLILKFIFSPTKELIKRK